jgi:hypothetical protein
MILEVVTITSESLGLCLAVPSSRARIKRTSRRKKKIVGCVVAASRHLIQRQYYSAPRRQYDNSSEMKKLASSK